MFLLRLFFALTVSMSVAITTQAMSKQPLPMSISYAVGAYRASPVIYKLTINGQVLTFSSVAAFGASRVPPNDGGAIVAYFPRLPAPDNTRLDIKVEWTDIWSGHQYRTETQLDEEHYPWFEGVGLKLNMTFEQNGGFVIRIISKDRWKEVIDMTSSGPITLADYIVAFDTCAPRLDGPLLSEAGVREQLNQIWAADIERLRANRDSPLPSPRCAGL